MSERLFDNCPNVRSQPDVAVEGVNVIVGMRLPGNVEWENVCSSQQGQDRMF